MLVLILFLLIISVFLLVIYYNKKIKVNKIVIEDRKIDRDIDLVFVSDFHIGKYMKKRELLNIIRRINNLGGDYLLIGGDLIGKNIKSYFKEDELGDILDKFIIDKRFYVEGNHDDLSLPFYDNFTILNDETIKISNNINLLGLKWNECECLDHKLNRSSFNILLSHYPDRVSNYSKVDLALGGHSHGRQVNLPFCKFHHKEKYVRGLYKLCNNRHLYVNRGIGFSFLKIRFFSSREIVKIELRKCDSNGRDS